MVTGSGSLGRSGIWNRSPRIAVTQELAHLAGVEDACPPVEADPPEREGPSEYLGEPRQVSLTVTEQEQGEGIEQVEGRRLAEEMNRQRAVATHTQERDQSLQEQVAQRQQEGHPQRHDLATSQPNDQVEDAEAIGHGVNHLAQRRSPDKLSSEDNAGTR